jgi:hypothetical protein
LLYLYLLHSNYHTSFSVCSLKSFDTRLSLCNDYIAVFRMLYVFFRIRLDHFLPVLLLIAQEPRTEKVIRNVASAQKWVCKAHFVKTSQNNMRQLHVKITIQKIYIHISVLNLFSCFQKFGAFNFIKLHKKCKI